MHRAGLPPINTQEEEEEEATCAVRVLQRCRAHPRSVGFFVAIYVVFNFEDIDNGLWTAIQTSATTAMFWS